MTDLILNANGAADAAPVPTLPPPNYHVSPEGLLITTHIAPGLSQQQFVPITLLREIMKKVREMMREQDGLRAIALDVMKTKH